MNSIYNTIDYNPTTNPMMTANAQVGEVSIDVNNNNVLVFDGSQWVTVQQTITPDLGALSSTEIEQVRKFIDNLEKYEKVLKEHFPEDYL